LIDLQSQQSKSASKDSLASIAGSKVKTDSESPELEQISIVTALPSFKRKSSLVKVQSTFQRFSVLSSAIPSSISEQMVELRSTELFDSNFDLSTNEYKSGESPNMIQNRPRNYFALATDPNSDDVNKARWSEILIALGQANAITTLAGIITPMKNLLLDSDSLKSPRSPRSTLKIDTSLPGTPRGTIFRSIDSSPLKNENHDDVEDVEDEPMSINTSALLTNDRYSFYLTIMQAE